MQQGAWYLWELFLAHYFSFWLSGLKSPNNNLHTLKCNHTTELNVTICWSYQNLKTHTTSNDLRHLLILCHKKWISNNLSILLTLFCTCYNFTLCCSPKNATFGHLGKCKLTSSQNSFTGRFKRILLMYLWYTFPSHLHFIVKLHWKIWKCKKWQHFTDTIKINLFETSTKLNNVQMIHTIKISQQWFTSTLLLHNR